MADRPLTANCAGGQHRACSGTARDDDTDELTACGCDCHAVPPTHISDAVIPGPRYSAVDGAPVPGRLHEPYLEQWRRVADRVKAHAAGHGINAEVHVGHEDGAEPTLDDLRAAGVLTDSADGQSVTLTIRPRVPEHIACRPELGDDCTGTVHRWRRG